MQIDEENAVFLHSGSLSSHSMNEILISATKWTELEDQYANLHNPGTGNFLVAHVFCHMGKLIHFQRRKSIL